MSEETKAKSDKKPNLEMLSKTLEGVQEQIRFADSKAAFVALFHTVLFGFVATQVDALSKVDGGDRTCAFWLGIILLLVYMGTAGVAVVFAVLCVVPNLGEAVPPCKIHFGHIFSAYGFDHQRYCREIGELDDCAWANDIGSQIVVNSGIATRKHKRAKVAALWTIAAVLLWVVTMLTMVFVDHKEDSGRHKDRASTAAVARS
jgi:hypothetical protein